MNFNGLLILMSRLLAFAGFFLGSVSVSAQNFSFNCARDTIVPGCPPNLCITLKAKIPDIHRLSTSYTLNPGALYPGGCPPIYVAPNDPAGIPTNLVVDDTWSSVIAIGFPFPFYGSIYSDLVVSANGFLSFDLSNANGSATWPINTNLPSSSYERAVIMGPMHDLDPSETTSPSQRIQYQVWGTAPHRRWILSYYKVPLYGGACNTFIENTHQIVLYESTGIIEVMIMSKEPCTAWNSGRAMVGIQDFNWTQGMMAPGRAGLDPPWGTVGMNESWRFVPNGGSSLLKRVELLDLGGNIIGTGTTAAAGTGVLEASFPNVCAPAGATTPYIVRSVYEKIDDPTVEIFGLDTIRVNRSAGLAATASSNPASCGSSNGTITVSNPTGGTPPYEYSLDNSNWQAGNTFTGLAPGNYTVYIRDNGAVCLLNIPVTVTVNGALGVTTTNTAAACTGVNNGSITIATAAGAGPWTFSLNGGPPQSGTIPYTFSNLAPGPYTIIVTDQPTGCASNPVSVTITTGTGVTVTTNSSGTSCPGVNNGSITITPTTGAAPFTYVLDGGAPQSAPGVFTFNNVSPGPHTVVVTDNVGCSRSETVNVAAGPILTTTSTKTDVLCNGGNTGSITVNQPATGTAPYEYSLNGTTWQAGNVFNGLSAGTYTVYYREANGCQGSHTVTITEPILLDGSAATVAVVCNGENNGTITVTASGGVAPYQYSIDGTNWQAGNVFSVPAGTYTVSIRDVNGCIVTRPVNVTEPAALTAIADPQPASCNGGTDGSITVTVSGGNPSYQYSVDGVNFQSSNVFFVTPGNYTVTVRDNLGCQVTTNAVVPLGNNFTMTPQADETICEGTSTQLNLVSNATVYSWAPAAGLSDPNIANPVANPVTTTQYIVTATLGVCTEQDTVIVNVNAAPIPDAGPDGFICYGQSYQLQGSGGVQYTWTPSTFLDDPTAPDPVSNPTANITYTLSAVIDALGCRSLVTDEVTIDVTPPIKVRTFPYDSVAYPGAQFQVLALTNDSDVINFSWTPAWGLSNAGISNPVVTVGAIGNDVTYQVTASTQAGCKGEGYVRIRVYKGQDIYVPTGFTPNGDGKNDRFTPFPVGIKELKYFRVFNRWGQMIFSTSKLHDGWDGSFGGKEQTSGVYVWLAEAITDDNRVITRRGTVTLIR